MKSKLPHFYFREIIALTYAFICSEAVARGGQRGGGGILFGIIGVIIAFFIFKIIGEALSPSSKSTDKVILGFIASIFAITLLLIVFK